MNPNDKKEIIIRCFNFKRILMDFIYLLIFFFVLEIVFEVSLKAITIVCGLLVFLTFTLTDYFHKVTISLRKHRIILEFLLKRITLADKDILMWNVFNRIGRRGIRSDVFIYKDQKEIKRKFTLPGNFGEEAWKKNLKKVLSVKKFNEKLKK